MHLSMILPQYQIPMPRNKVIDLHDKYVTRADIPADQKLPSSNDHT